MKCWQQETCENYWAGHKRRSHHVRITDPCVRVDNGTCPELNRSCDIAKVKKVKENLTAGPGGIHLMLQDKEVE